MLNAIIKMSGRTKPQFFGIFPTAHINDCFEQTSIWAVSGSHHSTAQPLILMVPTQNLIELLHLLQLLHFYCNKNSIKRRSGSGHIPVHFTSHHHKIRFNSQVLIHYCARYFTVVDDFIKQFLFFKNLFGHYPYIVY